LANKNQPTEKLPTFTFPPDLTTLPYFQMGVIHPSTALDHTITSVTIACDKDGLIVPLPRF
jgi:hypothetical protein